MDESWNTKEEQFFGLGLLMIPVINVGQVFDDMNPFFCKARDISEQNKRKRLAEYADLSDVQSLVKMGMWNNAFELKFKNINNSNKSVYKSLLSKYFSYSFARFSALIIDKSAWKQEEDAWSLYIQRATTLISKSSKQLPNARFILLSDAISQPRNHQQQYENTLINEIERLDAVIRVESHSSVLLQVVDILLGATMFFKKEEQGLVSTKNREKKLMVVEELQHQLRTPNFLKSLKIELPNFFQIEYR